MKKLVLVTLSALTLAGCAAPYTAEEMAEMNSVHVCEIYGEAMAGYGGGVAQAHQAEAIIYDRAEAGTLGMTIKHCQDYADQAVRVRKAESAAWAELLTPPQQTTCRTNAAGTTNCSTW